MGKALRLKVLSGGREEAVRIEPSERVEAGRDPAVRLHFDDPKLSRRHFTLACERGIWRVRDLGSANGTFVNGQRVAEERLQRGDLVQAGDVFIEVAAAGGGAVSAPRSTAAAARAPRRGVPPLAVAAVAAVTAAVAGLVAVKFALRDDAAPAPVATPRGAAVAGDDRAAAAEPVALAGGAESSARPGAGANPGSPVRPPSPERLAPVATRESAARSGAPRAPPPPSFAEIEPLIAAGAFRDALDRIDTLEDPAAPGARRDLRERVRDAASDWITSRVREARALARDGDPAAALALLERGFVNLPEDLVARLSSVHEEIRREAAVARRDHDRLEDLRARARRNVALEAAPPDPASARSAWTSRLAELERELTALRAAPPAVEEPWGKVAAGLRELAREWGADESYADWRPVVRDLFLGAQTEALRRRARVDFVSGEKAALRRGRLAVEYSFTTPEQAADFRPLGVRSDPPPAADRANGLVVEGEYRFLEGNPFRAELRVEVRLASGEYDAREPNFGVALFTEAADRLLARETRSLTQRLAAGGTPPADWLFAALGYRAAVADYGGTSLYEIQPRGGEAVALPAHLVIAGGRGKPLHWDARECLWALPVTSPLDGSVTLTLDARPDELTLRASGVRLGQRSSVSLALEAGAERSGSISLIARGAPVRVRFVRISGIVDQAWLTEQYTRAAERAFEEGAER